MTPIQVISCPLCTWTYQVKPLDERLNANTLAGIFGPGVMLNVAINRQTDETERALSEHFKTHTVVEWVKKVSDQQREIDLLRAEKETSADACMAKVRRHFDERRQVETSTEPDDATCTTCKGTGWDSDLEKKCDCV